MNLLSGLKPIVTKGAVYTAIILGGDTIGLLIASLLFLKNMFHFFTLLTLLQAALLFLIGGALDMGGSLSFHKLMGRVSKTESDWNAVGHRKAQVKAAPIILAGVILFVLSFALAYPLN